MLVMAELGGPKSRYKGKSPAGTQYKPYGLRNGATEFCLMMPRPCPTAGQQWAGSAGKAKALAGRWWTKGKVDTWQPRVGGAAKMDSMQTQGRTYAGHEEDELWGRGQII